MGDTKYRALVVDDSKVMRLMVMKGIRQSGVASFTFDEAQDGQEALEKFDEEPYDVLFVDWNMPRLNGVDFVRAIRDERKNRRVGIVMISSEKSAARIQEAVDEAGADAYVAKPFTAEIIESKLTGVIERLEQAVAEAEPKKKGLSRWLG